ncbi:MAG: translation initiation factor IF-3 [Gammaproteobacteria bacterium]
MAAEKKNRVNSQITSPKVRLIGEDGKQIGVVAIDEAQRTAEVNDLDLVEISPAADPPVCRVMDYGKFLYELNRKRQAAKKKQKQIQVKEIKIRPGTEEGDYQIKLRNLMRFLENGDKVKVTLRFRGREMAHQELGLKMLQRIEQDAGTLGVIEQHPKLEGRQMAMMVSPKKKP